MAHPATNRSAGPFDELSMLRKSSVGNMTASEQAAAGVLVGQTPHSGITVRMVVPAIAAAADTLDVDIQVSDQLAGTYRTIGSFEQITGAGSCPRDVSLRVAAPAGRPYMRYYTTITGTSPNFGAVQIGLVAGGF